MTCLFISPHRSSFTNIICQGFRCAAERESTDTKRNLQLWALGSWRAIPLHKVAQSSKQKQSTGKARLFSTLVAISQKPTFTWIPHCIITNPLSSQVPGYIPAMCILRVLLYYPSAATVPAVLSCWASLSVLRVLCTSISYEGQCLLMEQRISKCRKGQRINTDSRSLRNAYYLVSILLGFRIWCSKLLGTSVIAESVRWEMIISMQTSDIL